MKVTPHFFIQFSAWKLPRRVPEVVMGATLAQFFFKPEKNLEFFRLKICARDGYPGRLE